MKREKKTRIWQRDRFSLLRVFHLDAHSDMLRCQNIKLRTCIE